MYKERLKNKTAWSLFWPVLAAALVVRLVLAAVTEGYTYDMSCFISWGDKLLQEGPAAFYSADYFADYPPGYLPVLAGAPRPTFGPAWWRRCGDCLVWRAVPPWGGCCWFWCLPFATVVSRRWYTAWPCMA